MFDSTHHALFWILNYEAMSAFGYDDDQHPICEILNFNEKKSGDESNNQPFSDKRLNEFDQTLQECAEILNKNLDKMPDSNRLLIGNQLRTVYFKCSGFFKKYEPHDRVYRWVEKWNVMLNNKILSQTAPQ